ncbi:hypothetical protein KX75_19975 [Salmonella enterica subsp. enterica]|nr:hypothetical protein [Salmonella enterica subsp. enterica serovar Mikawasima]EDN7229154.1 hypothetical protein [Salmonella enterica subsp. enterica serovar Mikawasima]
MNTCTIIYRKPRASFSTVEPPKTTSSDNHPRSVLSLHREPLSAAEPEILPSVTNISQNRQRKAKRRQNKKRSARLQLLRDNWPQLFSTIRPLKTGIREDLVADARARQLALNENDISLCLRDWVFRTIYQKAVANGERRFDLSGAPVESISDADRAYACTQLAAMATAWKRQQDKMLACAE